MKSLRVFSGVCLAAAICVSAATQADDRGQALVIGDSVPFAFIASAGHEYINPRNFHGYADDLEVMLGVEAVDAACPGETTGSFLSAAAPDNGCRAYRANFPLHVSYTSTQADFATKYLKRHHEVRFVALLLGANDGFLLEDSCAAAANPALCIEAGVPTLLATVAGNIQTILGDLRGTGYDGPIIVANYYSLDYSNAPATGLTILLNSAIAAPASAYGAVVADLFTAFKNVASNPTFGGNSCNAALLNASVQNQLLCDVHPSQSGHRLIAETIAGAYRSTR